MKEIELINHRRGKGMTNAFQGTEGSSKISGANGVNKTRWTLKSGDIIEHSLCSVC